MNITRLGHRPTMYLFSDGVGELIIGLAMLFYSVAFSVLKGLPKNWGYGWGGFAGPLVLGLGAFGMVRGMKLLRERVTSPRGGYVTVRVTPYGRLAAGVSVAVMVGLKAIMDLHFSEALLYCAFFGCCYAVTGMIYRLPYMLLLAALSGLLLYWVSVKGGDLLLVTMVQGAMLAAAGAVKLWRFVRLHPMPTNAEAEA